MAQPRSPILVGFALLLALAAGVAAVVATGPGSRLHRPVLPAPVDPAPTTAERPPPLPAPPAAAAGPLRASVRPQPLVVVTVKGQVVDPHQRYIDLSPFPGLPAPIVISSWAHQLRIRSPGDPRLQRYVETFRVSPKYSPEYGPTCRDQPPAIGGVPDFS